MYHKGSGKDRVVGGLKWGYDIKHNPNGFPETMTVTPYPTVPILLNQRHFSSEATSILNRDYPNYIKYGVYGNAKKRP